MQRLLFVFGTRPEALKCFPVVREAIGSGKFETRVCVTGQHRQMLDQVLSLTGIRPDYDLDVMEPGQSLYSVSAKILSQMEGVLDDAQPDFILVQGDTTTAMIASLAAFYKKVPVGHIEAGLRSGNLYSPWPEEANRKMIGTLAALHFAPTERSRQSLIAEGVPTDKVIVTGNTVVDTLMHFSREIDRDDKTLSDFRELFSFVNFQKKVILVTSHRRENFDGGLANICHALNGLAERSDVEVVFPVHPNPKVQEAVQKHLPKRTNVHLIEPQDYLPFLFLLKQAHFVLTDSGGVQEEAPSLGKPVLVMRENTERPEGVDAGTAKLVGTATDDILREATLLLESEFEYQKMARSHNPFGDGSASRHIVGELLKYV